MNCTSILKRTIFVSCQPIRSRNGSWELFQIRRHPAVVVTLCPTRDSLAPKGSSSVLMKRWLHAPTESSIRIATRAAILFRVIFGMH